MSFSDWLISISIMSTRFTHVVAYVAYSFLRLNNTPSHVHTGFCLSIHPLMDIGYSHLLTIVNNAAMNKYLFKALLSILLGISQK